MRRVRQNRRKPEPLKLPAMPKLRINWRYVTLPPLAVAVVVLCAGAGRAWLDTPLTGLTVQGAFQRVRPIQVEAALGALGDQRFFTLDLEEVRQAIAAIDWVDTVELRRVWPGQLRVSITEHKAAASWGEGGLLNTRGELFTEDARFEYAELPRLDGPEGSERRVAMLYLDLSGRLAEVNLTLTRLALDDRGALTFTLAGGQDVRLGRDAHERRLDRFFSAAVPALGSELDRVRYVDLRYPNGFAVGWIEPAPDAPVQLARVDTDG